MKLLRALSLFLSLAAVHGQEDDAGETPDFDELMTEMDTNKDGKISWEEMFGGEEGGEDDWPEDIKQSYKATYKECDVDGDGLINRQELPTLFEKFSALEDAEDEKEESDEI
ncbi:unnamed protein product [Durusdinium trenchii]|uniref:EF-hand domain-containing protein n=1 Tax=Durusdinium trenchii TaxID=1381693 RepID=A0ABP0MN64_9DINO